MPMFSTEFFAMLVSIASFYIALNRISIAEVSDLSRGQINSCYNGSIHSIISESWCRSSVSELQILCKVYSPFTIETHICFGDLDA